MADKEVNIVITADASGATRSVSSFNNTLNGATGTTYDFGTGLNELNNSLGRLSRVQSFSFAKNLLSDLSLATKSIKATTKNIANLKQELSNFDLKQDTKWYNFSKLWDTFNVDPSRIGIFAGKRNNRSFAEMLEEESQIGVDLENQIKSAEELQSAIKTARTELTAFISKWSKLLLIISAVTAAIKLVKNAISVAATGDSIKDEANKVYLSTTAYQEWGYVLQQNGVEMSTLKMGMRTFAKEVANGDEALKKYGITATNVDEAFEDAVYTIQQLGTQTEKIAAMTELFGTRASELMPIFNMNPEDTQALMDTYRAIGGTMWDQLINDSDVLTDSITEMKAAWQGLANTIGSTIIPVLSQVVQAITKCIAYINVFLSAFFGIEKTFGSVGASDGSSALAEDLESAAGSAKELKHLISGFDELNIFSESSGGGSSSSVDWEDYTEGTGALDDAMTKLEEFQKKMEDWRENLNLTVEDVLIDWSDLTGEQIAEKIFWGLTTLGGAALGFAIGGVPGALIGTLAGCAISLIFESLIIDHDGKLSATEVISLLLPVLGAMTGLVFSPIGSVIGFSIGTVLSLVLNRINWKNKSNFTMYAPKIVLALVGGIAGILVGGLVGGLVGVTIGISLTFLIQAAKTIFGDSSDIDLEAKYPFFSDQWISQKTLKFGKTLSDNFSSLKEGIRESWDTMWDWDMSEAVTDSASGVTEIVEASFNPTITSMSDTLDITKTNTNASWTEMKDTAIAKIQELTASLSSDFDTIKTNATTKVSETTANITEKWQNLKSDASSLWNNIKTTVTTKASEIKEKAVSKFEEMKQKINTTWNNVSSSASESFSKIQSTITNTWEDISSWYTKNIAPKFTISYWSSKFSCIKEGLKEALSGLGSAVIEKVRSAVNSFNNSKILTNINSKFNIDLKIPSFASGGVLTTPTLNVAGDAGPNNPEIITPQSLMTSIIKTNNNDLISAFAQMTKQLITAIEDKDMDVRIGDQQIARSAQRGNQAYKLQTGKSLF